MAKNRTNTGSEENRKTSDSSDGSLPIPMIESEAFGVRLKSAIGNESLRAFARRCSISDGLLGAYIRGEKSPGLEILVTMTSALSVTVDWLATGRLPKYRRELTHSMSQGSMQSSNGPLMVMEYSKGIDPAQASGTINAQLLQLCLKACKHAHGEAFTNTLTDSQILYATDLYNQLVALANAKSPPTNLEDFCRLEAKALADQLRFFLQMGWALKFPPSAAPWS